jgi:outer membrane protein OmpA-like peptidoglycan-associated protein
MHFIIKQSIVPALLASLLALGAAAVAQAKDPLFGTLSAALQKARNEQVDALAPGGYRKAIESYENAMKDAQRSRSPERIKKQLSEGMAALDGANKSAAAARETLRTAIAARNDAIAAQAPKFAAEQWLKAATRFNEAASAAERNDLKGAQRRGAESEVLLRDVELSAIKGGILNEARGLIAQAEAAKVEKTAPRSLQAAKRHLAQAEQEIAANRYDTSMPKNLAAQAGYEARHALHLSGVVSATMEKQKDDRAGIEELVLSWEEPLRKIAAEMNVAPKFDTGMQSAMQDMLVEAQRQREQVNRLKQELDDRNEQIAALNREMQRLESRLGGVSEERIALQRRVDAQERLRANVASIESSFSPGEARAYRQADDVVISLTGIGFASGKSTIDSGSAPLMGKVQQALKLFPDAPIVVEGHTDSNGSDSNNLILSQDRADAVKQYLVSNAGVNPEKISSIGYGEARPVSTNETAEGRTRNRRIDLVLHVGSAR